MSAHTFVVVYNTSQDGIVVDEEGHSIDPQSWRCARRSFVRDHIDNGRLIVIDMDTITDESNPTARLAKDEAVAANADVEAAKSPSSPAPKATAAKVNADKSTTK